MNCPFVQAQRKRMAEFNHCFFTDIYENYETIDITEKQELLRTFIKEKMDAIGNREYRLGRDFIRRGYELVKNS